MASVVINNDQTGAIVLQAPAVSGTSTLTLPSATDTLVGLDSTQTLTNKTLSAPLTMAASMLTSGDVITLSSNTSVEFAGIPSWAKEITVLFDLVTPGGSSNPQLQIGSTTYVTSGYSGYATYSTIAPVAFTSGFLIATSSTANKSIFTGHATLRNLTGNIWVFSSTVCNTGGGTTQALFHGSGILLSGLTGALDRVQFSAVNGTDAYTSGVITLLYK